MAARYSGINTRRTVILVYIISGILSACSGILLISKLGSGQPTIGDGAELDAIASCVVGGVSMNGGSGTLMGTLFGCLIIGIISNVLNLIGVNSYIQLIVKGVIIVLSIYLEKQACGRKKIRSCIKLRNQSAAKTGCRSQEG